MPWCCTGGSEYFAEEGSISTHEQIGRFERSGSFIRISCLFEVCGARNINFGSRLKIHSLVLAKIFEANAIKLNVARTDHPEWTGSQKEQYRY